MMSPSDKRPRQYASEIAKLTTKEERREAFRKVPTAYKPLVNEHLKTIMMRRQYNGHTNPTTK